MIFKNKDKNDNKDETRMKLRMTCCLTYTHISQSTCIHTKYFTYMYNKITF